VLLDLVVLTVLALAALHGAMGGALRQLVQLLAAVVGWVAARHLAAPVAAGLGHWFPGFLARPGASALLFLGTYAAVSLLGGAVLSGAAGGVVRGPADRGAGALLGGVKGGLGAWVLLSALALAGGVLPGRFGEAGASEYLGLARGHNLLVKLDPSRVRVLERILDAARAARRQGAPAGDREAAEALLSDPRIRPLAEAGTRIDPAEAGRLLADPHVRELAERLRGRVAEAE
jgi:membrane protein required for colicin V production